VKTIFYQQASANLFLAAENLSSVDVPPLQVQLLHETPGMRVALESFAVHSGEEYLLDFVATYSFQAGWSRIWSPGKTRIMCIYLYFSSGMASYFPYSSGLTSDILRNLCETHAKAEAMTWEVSTLNYIYGVAEISPQHHKFDGNRTMSAFITISASLTKCQTITFITNSSDELP
jgi:hypothetical protein